MNIKYLCVGCKKTVRKNTPAIQCDLCDQWTCISCASISKERYCELTLSENNDPFLCNSCTNDALPFSNESDKTFTQTNILGLNENTNITDLSFSLSKSEKKSISQISNLILENNDPDCNLKGFCDYYTIDDFLKKKFKQNEHFSIFHLNTHSLQFHKNDLDILLDTLKFEFDIIAISETKLQKNTPPIHDISIPNYTIEHTPTEATKGGTLLYVSNKFDYKPRKDLQIYESRNVESTFVEIIRPKDKNIIIGCIYKHHTITQKDFRELLSPIITKVSRENKICYLAGDFNMNLLNIDKDTEIEKYFDLLTSNKFMPLITCPTRIGKSSKTLIDNIFYNQFSSDIKSGNLTVGISDHTPQFALIPTSINMKNNPKQTIKIRKFKHVNCQKFNQDLNSIDWTMEDEDVNRYGTNFINVFNQILNGHAPIKEIKMTKSKLKQKTKPWVNNDILSLIKTKDKLYTKYIKESNVIIKANLLKEYKSKKNEITQQIRKSKKEYYNKYFENNSNNIKKLWLGINKIINKTKNTDSSPVCIEIDTDGNVETVTEPKLVAKEFNNHYANVADKILHSRKFSGNKEFHKYLKTPNPKSFLIKPTTPQEIELIISKLDTNKAVGPNSIPNKLIKSISKSISIPLTNIFNSSFTSGIFPEFLKISTIIPIYKKDSKLKVANYRPISLLSNINKILEKLMFQRLYTFLEKNKCIYDLQFGFRQNHSTNHALLSMTQEIKDTIEKGKIAIGVFVDFQKAFDTVNHQILLRKLHHYGIRGSANDWFKSYLTKRRQCVSINGTTSESQYTKHGVPQGSVLGPLLFLIYINDLHNCIKHSTVRHFADDTNLLYSIKKKEQDRNRNIVRNLNTDLRSLNQWLLANKISLNSTKTELIFFRKINTPIPNLKIKLNGVRLKESSEVKYVGIIFDEYLTFNTHIRIMNARLKRANNLIAISRHYVSKELLRQIYYGQFYSHLNYGCQLWGQNSQQIAQTITLQNKAVRLMSFSHFQAHANTIFKNLKLLKLSDIIKLSNIVFTHNTINKKSPTTFNNYFKIKQTKHQHNTTNNPNSEYSIPKGSLELPNYISKTGQSSIRYTCARDWNIALKKLSIKFPTRYNSNDNWLQSLSINALRYFLKQHFIDDY